jgi:translation initiation factor RLI1
MKKTMNAKTQVQLPVELLFKAEQRATSLGLTLSEYVQNLVDKDVAAESHNPWLEPVPKEVDEEWERDIAEFDEQEKIKPHPGATTVSKLKELLRQEAERLSNDEGD